MANDVQVVDRDTGNREYIDAAEYDAARHELVGGQTLTVDPLAGIEGVETEAGLALDIEREQAVSYEEVAPERRAALTREAVSEELYGDEGWTEFGRGAGAGATFGISEYLMRPDDPFERERRQRTREQHEDMYAYGNLAGSIAPALLSGGSGALGAAARLTPAGRVAAGLGRYSAGGKIGRQLLAGAVDGALDGFGQALAEQSLSDNPISADVILSRTLTGGLLGGGIAGGMHVAGSTLAAGARALGPAPVVGATADVGRLRKLLGEAEPAEHVAKALDDRAAGADWRSVFHKGQKEGVAVQETVADVHRALDRTRIVNKRGRSVEKELLGDASVSEALARGVDKLAVDRVSEGLRKAQVGFRRASKDARAWGKTFAGEIGDNADEVTAILSKMDTAKTQLDQAIEQTIETMVPAERRAAMAAKAAAEPSGIAGLKKRTGDRFKSGALADAVAGAELLSDVTGYQPTQLLAGIPVIGDAASAYLKLRALKNAFGRRMPRTATSKAAAESAAARDRIATAAANLGRALKKPAARTIATKAAGAIRNVVERANEGTMISSDDAATLADLPPEVGAQVAEKARRAASYIAKVAPPDPLADAPYATDLDRTHPYEAREFSIRMDAIEYPSAVVAAVLEGGHPRPSLAIEALEAVYPEILDQARMDLTSQLDAIVDRVPAADRARFGLLLGVPLDVSTTSAYQQAMARQAPPAPAGPRPSEGRRAAPRVNTVAADLEQTDADRRA